MRVSPWRPFRPATFSGKKFRPAVLRKRTGESFWLKVRNRLRARKAKQRAAREKRGYAMRWTQ